MTEEPTIAIVTSDFGDVYRSVKGYKDENGVKQDGWEQLLKDAQAEFFAAATRELEVGTLARKTVTFPEMEYQSETLATEYIDTHHPGWRLVEIKDGRGIIEEDPALKSYVYVNYLDGMVYRRSQTQTGPSLDVERLQEDDPDLYAEISVWDPKIYDAVREGMVWAYDSVKNPNPEVLADEETEKYMTSRCPEARIILDPSQWTDKQAAALQDYLLPGKVSVRLTPPRPATDEELETGEVQS